MLLEVKNLGIAYGDKPPIVQGVTFNLDEGEILAIVGESGSGKTTVIRAIQHVLPGGGHSCGSLYVGYESRVYSEGNGRDCG